MYASASSCQLSYLAILDTPAQASLTCIKVMDVPPHSCHHGLPYTTTCSTLANHKWPQYTLTNYGSTNICCVLTKDKQPQAMDETACRERQTHGDVLAALLIRINPASSGPEVALSEMDFWKRMGLKEKDRAIWLEVVQRRYNGYDLEEFEYQGYCSFTLLLSPRYEHDTKQTKAHSIQNSALKATRQLIIQLRPPQYALDLETAWAAFKAYTPLTPNIQSVSLCLVGGFSAYEMERLEGTPMSCLQPHECSSGTEIQKKQECFIASYAKLIAQVWPGVTGKKRSDGVLRPKWPVDEETTMLSQCTGKVGSCITRKLEILIKYLPDLWLRHRAQSTLDKLCMVDRYPVVLNHGDLILSNILVDDETWEITGLVDWAEAEYLPFGTCLYGLDHFLGFYQPSSQELGGPTFVYYDHAPRLRELFWSRLFELVPEIGRREDEVRLMRDVGVLLWHGYAWDEGVINRVVNEANDIEELSKLRAFLSV